MPPSHPDNAKLRIGLIVDSTTMSAGIFELAEWCQNQSAFSISHLLLTAEPRDRRHALRGKCLTWIAKLEALLIRNSNLRGIAADHDLRSLIPEVMTLGSGETGRRAIDALQLDLLLIAGSCAIPDGICRTATLGAIRICYGGGAAGFREVLLKHDYTGFCIRRLSNDSEASTVLVNGRIATQYCYALNKMRIEQKCLHYTRQVLSGIARERKMPEPGHSMPACECSSAMPGLLDQALYLVQLAFRLAHRAVRSAYRLDFRWSVAYQKRGWQEMNMASAVKIPRPGKHFLADPFVASEGGGDYCFLEDYDYIAQKGHIAVYRLHDDRAECLGNALVEPFHLSFPYLFRYKSELYMCPETSRNRQIRMYKCLNFPLQWQLHTVLMDDVSAADTMLFEHDGRWWMLTNRDVAETGDYCTELSIYWADSPLSSRWTAHAANPVVIDAAKGRNAGLLFDAEHIYRVAQKQGFERYGKAFSINRIDCLNETTYRETEVRTVQADFFAGTKGTHHMHSNGTVTVFDFI